MAMSRHSSIGKGSKIEVQKARQFADKLQYFLDNCRDVHEGAKKGEVNQKSLLNDIQLMQEG